MSMTVPQKKYFCNRIDEITGTKTILLQSSVPKEASPKDIILKGMAEGQITLITNDELKKLIHQTVKEKNMYSNSYMPSLEIEKLVKGYESYYRRTKHTEDVKNDFIAKQIETLCLEATKIKDIAMFGSSAEAHLMLKEFIEWEGK